MKEKNDLQHQNITVRPKGSGVRDANRLKVPKYYATAPNKVNTLNISHISPHSDTDETTLVHIRSTTTENRSIPATAVMIDSGASENILAEQKK